MSLNCWKIYFRNIPHHYWNLKIKAPLPLNTYICILIESNIVWAGSFSVELPKNTTISFQCTKITQKKSSTFVLYSFTMVLKLRNYKEKQKKVFGQLMNHNIVREYFLILKERKFRYPKRPNLNWNHKKLHCARNNNETFLISDSLWKYWMLNVFWIFS